MQNRGGALTPHGEAREQGGSEVPRPKEKEVQHPRKAEMQNRGGVLTPPKTEQNRVKVSTFKRHSHLPHIDSTEYYQFVTFRTHDSLDEFIKKQDLDSTLSYKEKQLKIDEHLDNSSRGAYLQNEVLHYLYRFLLAQDKKLYDLVAFVIMNNHVHLLFKPLESLKMVMKKIKGASAKRINELLGKSGSFWSDDYYDKAIRDERHFWVVYEYIRNNPLKLRESEVIQNGGGALTPYGEAGEQGGTEVPRPKKEEVASLIRFYGVFE